MASRTVRPGRTLLIFLLAVVFMYGLAAIGGTWKPKLGLDLAGGTTITLVPQGNPAGSQLGQAASIIRQRVNGNGVTEAQVATQGSQIVVSIPGMLSPGLVDSVSRQAQPRFRVLAECGSNPCEAGGLPAKKTPTKTPAKTPSKSPTATPTKKASPTAKPTASGNGRPAFDVGASTTGRAKSTAASTPSPSPTLPLTVPSASPSSSTSND